MNFIPCVSWVKRGVSKRTPDKVHLTQEEIAALLADTKRDLEDLNLDDDDDVQEATGNDATVQEDDSADPMAKYGLENYDKEIDEEDRVGELTALGDLAVYANNDDDPYVTIKGDEDSEKGDFEIRPDDNLIVVGRVEGDASSLEIYVYNEEAGHLYIHHDIFLPSYPMCAEWLNFDPSEGNMGNFVAVGNMTCVIEVWDLDLVDSLEPAFKLGKKPRKKKNIPGVGHTDAVLALAWNSNTRNVLASGSADQTVILWDLNESSILSTLNPFQNNVQSLQWHQFESQTLLTGSCDKKVRMFDCRGENSFKLWEMDGEVERILWNHFNPFCFFASTDTGMVNYYDARSNKPLWTLRAHDKEVTGLSLSSKCPGCLVTASTDKKLKLWDFHVGTPSFVYERDMKLGSLYCLSSCPDAPFVFCMGGDNSEESFRVWDIRESSAGLKKFGKRQLLEPVLQQHSDVPNETAVEVAIDIDQPSTSTKKKKKRKKKNVAS